MNKDQQNTDHKRFFIKLAYNGSEFHGWQKQLNASSVQETLEHCLSLLVQESLEIIGCGRTDTGVHAREFFAHFNLNLNNNTIFSPAFINKLNNFLPKSIVVYNIFPVEPLQHARFSAISRTYKYYLHTQKDPFVDNFSLLFHQSLAIDKMNEASKILLEYKDFSCFSKSGTQTKTNNCKIMHAQWEADNDKYIFTITADRFLRNMVRAIVGTLLEVGIRKINTDDFRKIIENKNRSYAGVSVPAKALFLEKIEY